MSGASGLLLLHASYLGLGLALLRGVAARAGWSAALLLPLAWLTGVLGHVAVLLALLALRIAGGLPARFGDGADGFRASHWGLVALGCALGLAVGGRALREALARGEALVRERRARRADGVPDATGPDARRRRRKRKLATCAALSVLLALPAGGVALAHLGQPDTAFDSVAFWNVKAEILLSGAGLDAAQFTDAARVHPNPSYPLGRPLFTAQQHLAVGRIEPLGAGPGHLLLLLAGYALLGALLAGEIGRAPALAALALLLWTPLAVARPIPGAPTTSYVDVPLGLLFAATLGFALRALRRQRGAELAGLAAVACLAVLLKDEARLFMALLLPAVALAAWLRLPRGERRWIAVLAAPLAVIAGWKLIAADLATTIYIHPPTPRQIADLPALVPRIAAAMAANLSDVQRWAATPACVALLFLAGLAVKWRRAEVLVALVPLGQLAVACAGLGLLQLQKGGLDNWMAHAWERFVLQLLPGLLLVGLALLSRERARKAGAQSG